MGGGANQMSINRHSFLVSHTLRKSDTTWQCWTRFNVDSVSMKQQIWLRYTPNYKFYISYGWSALSISDAGQRQNTGKQPIQKQLCHSLATLQIDWVVGLRFNSSRLLQWSFSTHRLSSPTALLPYVICKQPQRPGRSDTSTGISWMLLFKRLGLSRGDLSFIINRFMWFFKIYLNAVLRRVAAPLPLLWGYLGLA